MNTNELANFLDDLADDWAYEGFDIKEPRQAATMLRQQANRIAELEKDLHMVERHYGSLDNSLKVNQECNSIEENKPVVYWDGKCFASKDKSSLAEIPLYTHPVKELHLSLQKEKETGELLAVTYTDDEHRIVEVLWQRPPVKELTDEEIDDIGREHLTDGDGAIEFARAILRKAQEK